MKILIEYTPTSPEQVAGLYKLGDAALGACVIELYVRFGLRQSVIAKLLDRPAQDIAHTLRRQEELGLVKRRGREPQRRRT